VDEAGERRRDLAGLTAADPVLERQAVRDDLGRVAAEGVDRDAELQRAARLLGDEGGDDPREVAGDRRIVTGGDEPLGERERPPVREDEGERREREAQILGGDVELGRRAGSGS
jgi:hypothetical protein